jgi:hypothetical protein
MIGPQSDDAEKLRHLADWFDEQDSYMIRTIGFLRGIGPKVQDDLRRIAEILEVIS